MAYVARMGSIWSSGEKGIPLGDLPVFAKVRDPGTTIYGNPIILVVGDHSHAGYPANSVTLVAANILKIMATDGKEASNSDSYRKNYGNNRHVLSNIRQWLNKSGASWYTAMHGWDAPPNSTNVSYNPYDTVAGFLTGFSANMLAALLDTTLTVAKATVDGGGSETFSDKVFLLSKAEVGLGAENSISEGSLLAMFSSAASTRICMPTADAVSNSGYTHAELTAAKNWYYWLRSPRAGDSNLVCRVNLDGSENQNYAHLGVIGLRPALNLPSSARISKKPDINGIYDIIW